MSGDDEEDESLEFADESSDSVLSDDKEGAGSLNWELDDAEDSQVTPLLNISRTLVPDKPKDLDFVESLKKD